MQYADVVASAREHPVYARILKEADGQEVRITREQYHSELEKGEQRAVGGYGDGVLWLRSGGMVTARRWHTPALQSEWQQQHSTMRSFAARIGLFPPGLVVLPLLQDGCGYPVYHEISELLSQSGCSMLPCDAGVADDVAVRISKRFGATAVVGTRARVVQLAWHLLSQRRRYPFSHVILYGDVPTATQQRAIDKAFSDMQHGKHLKPRLTGVYGTSELGLLGFSPHQLRDPRTVLYDPAVVHVAVDLCQRHELPPTSVRRTAELYENQKRYPMVGWQSKAMPGGGGGERFEVWTAPDGTACRKDQVKLPGEEYGTWEWQGGWKAAGDWEYAADFRGPWHPDEVTAAGGQKGDAKFRRKLWRAGMVKIDTAPELEAGHLLVTLLCRSKCPVLCYDTDDLAKKGDVVFAGDKYPALRLGGRRLDRFSVGGSRGDAPVTIFVSEFTVPLFHYLIWQVVVDSVQDEGGAADRVTVRAVISPDRKPPQPQASPPASPRGASSPRARPADDESRTVPARIREALQTPRADPLPHFVIEFKPCSPCELIHHELSGRLRPFIDTRGGARARR